MPDALRARRHRGRAARVRARPDRARRRGLRVQLDRGVLERRVLRRRARTPCRTRGWRPTSPTRTTRRAARCAGSARSRSRSRTRRRWTSSPPPLGMDPIELRLRNAIAPGDRLPTGQVLPEPAPVAELLERVRDMPLPPAPAGAQDQRELPGGVANTTHGEGVRRGVGYAVGIKNVGFSEGFDDYSTRARARLRRRGRAAGRGPHGGGRGGPGRRDGPGPDRPHRAGDRARGRAARRHRGGLGGLDVRVAPDLRDRRSGQGGVRGGARRAGRARRRAGRRRRARRAARRAAGRGDRRVAPPADVPARRARPGRRAPAVRVLRAPGRGRRRLRAGARPRRRARDRAGGRARDQPAGARGPDRGRHRRRGSGSR